MMKYLSKISGISVNTHEKSPEPGISYEIAVGHQNTVNTETC